MKNRTDLTKIKAPVIFRAKGKVRYTKPKVWYDNGELYLSVVAIIREEEQDVYRRLVSHTKNLIYWSSLEPDPRDDREAVQADSIFFREDFCEFRLRFVEGEGCNAGSILLAISKDEKHWITFERDRATFPDNGVVYEGDYYKAIPFGEYIRHEDLPTERIYDIRDYGAVPDGVTLSTQAFQAAVAAARSNGGGVILVTGGHYSIGTVQLYDNMTLFIDFDAALVASKNLSMYRDALVCFIDAKNISIRGGGKIIGCGEYFVHLPLKRPLTEPMTYTKLPPRLYDPMGYPVDTIRYAYRARIRYADDRYRDGLPHINRPMYTVWIRGCTQVDIQNVIIEDALDWTLDIDYCDTVNIKDLVINGNRHVANTDGIDVMSSRNVRIDHCFISCADDGLCIKAPRMQGHDGFTVQDEQIQMGPVENVHISNCTVLSVMNAFKIGTETYFDIKNVLVEDCKFMLPDIYPGGVSGISIESADGSHVSDITLRNIVMDKIACPIFICLNMRNKFGFANEVDREKRYYGGSISNVVIEQIKAYHVEVPSIITGFEVFDHRGRTERKLENIRIQDALIIYRDNDEKLELHDMVVESITDYPENNSFGDVPAYGFYVRHAQEVSLKGLEIVPRSSNTRPDIIIE